MRKALVLQGIMVLVLGVGIAEAHGPGGEASAMFKAYEHGSIPTPYKGKKNPLKENAAAVKAGMTVYENNCVMCHGASADGKGHMAPMVSPPPSDLRQMLQHYPNSDDYYFWVIKDGGGNYGTSMPGFGQQLSDDHIWQVISWMQGGFPGAGTDVQDRMHDHENRPTDNHMTPGTGAVPNGSHMMTPGQGMGQ